MQSLTYSALEPIRVPRPVDRLHYMEQLVEGKVVFDLGALDETAIDVKQAAGSWLHSRLCNRALRVIGIDNSELVPPDGLQTHANGRIIRADIFDLPPVIELHGRPDVIVAGELIEHLPHTIELLSSMKDNHALHGAELVISTPNACSWHNILIGLAARESTHCDHLQIYSYKTLRTLFDRSGLEFLAMVPYHARFPEMIADSGGIGRASVQLFQRSVNFLEWATPLLSSGWIAKARI